MLNIRTTVLGLLLGGAMMPSSAQATGMFLSQAQLPPGTPMATCLQRAAMAIASMGMRPLTSSASAAWGARDGGRVFSIYCLPANNVVTVVGAGNTTAEVSADVTALAAAFRSVGTAGGTGGQK